MKSGSLIAIVVAILTMTFVAQNAMADTTFDGTWSVTAKALKYRNSDGTTALPWSKQFPAQVKNGVLHGEWGTRGKRGWIEIDGKIEHDGAANLHANGINFDPEHGENRSPANTPYEYQINAHFSGRRGSGKSVGPRVRTFDFAKE